MPFNLTQVASKMRTFPTLDILHDKGVFEYSWDWRPELSGPGLGERRAAQEPATRRPDYLQDFNENNSNDAAIAAKPKKNTGPTAKCSSTIHHDNGSDIKPVSAGTKRKNIVTKPLSLPVTVNAI